MAKLHTDRDSIVFHCPGCKEGHRLPVTGPQAWGYNQDVNSPTLTPSILVHSVRDSADRRCHSYVRGGRIEFLSDCSHELAGRTVDLPEWFDPTGMWDSGPPPDETPGRTS